MKEKKDIKKKISGFAGQIWPDVRILCEPTTNNIQGFEQ
jgi:hypothetical protein